MDAGMHKEASERRRTIMKNKNYQLYYQMQDTLDGLYAKDKETIKKKYIYHN